MNLRDKAILVATKAHSNQDYEIFPYIYHPLEVEELAIQLGYNETIQISCILHDVLEDSSISYHKLKIHFNERIADICFCVWDEKGHNRKEKHEKTYPGIKADWEATVVKVLDRCVNIKNSSEFNSGKNSMYKKEHIEFVKALYDPINHPAEVDKAWCLFEELTKTSIKELFNAKV